MKIVQPPEPANEDESMSRLLHFAGPRMGMDGDAMTRLEHVARPAWREKVRAHTERRRRRTYRTLALAAVVVLSVGLAVRFAPFDLPGPADASVAAVEARSGTVSLPVGHRIEAGATVETGPQGRLVLRLQGGTRVRLDVDTHLDVRGAGDLRLEHGAVYVDTDGGRGGSLRVETLHGVASDIGTQFEVRFTEEVLRIQVREGEVRLDAGTESHPARAGTVLTVLGDGTVERGVVAPYGAAWEWILETRPPFEAEGRTVRELLDWYCRETGLELRLTGAVDDQLASTVTAGPGSGLTPTETLEAVLPGAGLSFRVEEGSLEVAPLRP